MVYIRPCQPSDLEMGKLYSRKVRPRQRLFQPGMQVCFSFSGGVNPSTNGTLSNFVIGPCFLRTNICDMMCTWCATDWLSSNWTGWRSSVSMVTMTASQSLTLGSRASGGVPIGNYSPAMGGPCLFQTFTPASRNASSKFIIGVLLFDQASSTQTRRIQRLEVHLDQCSQFRWRLALA